MKEQPVDVEQVVFETITSLFEDAPPSITRETPLIGDASVLDSMKLVELCLELEDKASEMDFEFDWRSDAAMSRSRSMFRTAGALADEFRQQMESQQ